MLFHETGHFLHFFPEKFIEMPKHGSLFEKLQVLAKSMIFRVFITKRGTFCNLLLKSSSKGINMVLCSKKLQVLAQSMIFRVFSGNEALSATFR